MGVNEGRQAEVVDRFRFPVGNFPTLINDWDSRVVETAIERSASAEPQILTVVLWHNQKVTESTSCCMLCRVSSLTQRLWRRVKRGVGTVARPLSSLSRARSRVSCHRWERRKHFTEKHAYCMCTSNTMFIHSKLAPCILTRLCY